MAEKIYSPREAALAVLAKAEELYKNSSLAKAERKSKKPLEKDGNPPPPPAAQSSTPPQQTLGAAIGYPDMGKAEIKKSDEEGHNPDEKADAKLGEEVEKDVQEHEEHNEDPGHAEPPMKGHIKLAKFMGRMEHKKSLKSPESSEIAKKESAFDKVKNSIKSKEGYSDKAAAATAAKIGRESLGEAEMARRSAAGRKKS